MPFDAVAYINEPRWAHSSLGLERMQALMELLGSPQGATPAVHVAGTNGKGSTCMFLASMLQAAGYRTGLFTSPAIRQPRRWPGSAASIPRSSSSWRPWPSSTSSAWGATSP